MGIPCVNCKTGGQNGNTEYIGNPFFIQFFIFYAEKASPLECLKLSSSTHLHLQIHEARAYNAVVVCFQYVNYIICGNEEHMFEVQMRKIRNRAVQLYIAVNLRAAENLKL